MMLIKEKAYWDLMRAARWLGLRTGRRRQEILSLIMLEKTGKDHGRTMSPTG